MISVHLSQEFLEQLAADVLFDWWPDITGTTVHIPGTDDGYARMTEVQPGEWIPVAWCRVWIQPPCAMKPPKSPLPRCEQCVGYLTITGLPDPAELALRTDLRRPPVCAQGHVLSGPDDRSCQCSGPTAMSFRRSWPTSFPAME